MNPREVSGKADTRLSICLINNIDVHSLNLVLVNSTGLCHWIGEGHVARICLSERQGTVSSNRESILSVLVSGCSIPVSLVSDSREKVCPLLPKRGVEPVLSLLDSLL